MGEDFLERRLSGLVVRIDRTTCIGSGSCTRVAPDLFELDSTLVVTFADRAGDADGAPEVPRERVLEACSVCPVDALSAEPDGASLLLHSRSGSPAAGRCCRGGR